MTCGVFLSECTGFGLHLQQFGLVFGCIWSVFSRLNCSFEYFCCVYFVNPHTYKYEGAFTNNNTDCLFIQLKVTYSIFTCCAKVRIRCSSGAAKSKRMEVNLMNGCKKCDFNTRGLGVYPILYQLPTINIGFLYCVLVALT